jgi:hypothetical protein
MLKWFIGAYFIALTPLFAMDPNLVGLEKARPMVRYRVGPPRGKSADEMIAEARAAGHIQFLSCEEWLRKERPHFNEASFAPHPLFPALRNAMALADFEVDILTGFTHRVMKPDMGIQETGTLIPLRDNAITTKRFLNDFIECLEGKSPFEGFIEEHLEWRLKNIIAYQAEIMGGKKLSFDKQQVKARRLTEANGKYADVQAGFLRSYNTKNAIIRDILHFLRDKHGKALIQCLPLKVVHLLTLSSSLHTFLNGENEEWLDYDVALERGEGQNFLGNAAQLGVDLQQFFNAEKIRGVKKPKAFTELHALPIPAFLKAKKKKQKIRSLPMVALSDPTEEECLMLGIAKITGILKEMRDEYSPPPQAPAPQPNAGAAAAPGAPATAVTTVTTAAEVAVPHPSGGDGATASASSSPMDSSVASTHRAALSATTSSASDSTKATPKLERIAPESFQLSAAPTVTGSHFSVPSASSAMPTPPNSMTGAASKVDKKDEKKGSKAVQAVDLLATAAAGTGEGRTDTHADTIYDIFRPHGYKRLDDACIITAWKHVLQGNGRLKKNTGRNHQPLYADLQDDSQVVMRFFRSSGYGPNYMKYVREAFDAIGFGRAWLIKLGYKL